MGDYHPRTKMHKLLKTLGAITCLIILVILAIWQIFNLIQPNTPTGNKTLENTTTIPSTSTSTTSTSTPPTSTSINIACFTDSDCGTVVEEYHCYKEYSMEGEFKGYSLYLDKTTPICKSPGTAIAECINIYSKLKVDDCRDYEVCVDGKSRCQPK